MAQLAGSRGSSSSRTEMEGIARNMDHSSRRPSIAPFEEGEDIEQHLWAAIERLPSFERMRTSMLRQGKREEDGEMGKPCIVDVTKLGAQERQFLMENLIKHIERDNLRLLQKQKQRLERVSMKPPTNEVRYKNLRVEVKCEDAGARPFPTLWNETKGFFLGFRRLLGIKKREERLEIVKDVSGIIKPSRMTLLLGPPGCGKTTFMLALAGKLNKPLEVSGDICYNGLNLEEFVPQKTSVYVSQNDLHIPEMTVREILDFSAWFQGTGNRAQIMKEVIKREKQCGIIPEPEVDAFMKAISIEGLRTSLHTDYTLKIMGLENCAHTIVGDAMRRGISGGQKKRLTTGEMIVGPTKVLFMDEISTGLDSSTTFQTITCFQQLAHITEATVVVSLLQPAPETYDLFDDIILMAEGRIVYHGPRTLVLPFFEESGFKCPERKGVADFLQEVLSRKDQEQYWDRQNEDYTYVSADQFSNKFKAFHVGERMAEELSKPNEETEKDALSFNIYSLPKWELFKSCIAREMLLMKRNSFIYVMKTSQMTIGAVILMTVFLRTRLRIDMVDANYYLGSLYFVLAFLFVNGFPELSLTVSRLPVFYKQRDCYFYPSWAYTISTALLKIPISLLDSLICTGLTYYVIGYSPEAVRFFRHFLILFTLHQMSLSSFRFIACLTHSTVTAINYANIYLMIVITFGGFILSHPYMPSWLRWGFWISPITYGQISIVTNEFLAPRWQKLSSQGETLGNQVLTSRGLNYSSRLYWVSVGALIGYTILFNAGFAIFLSYKTSMGMSQAITTSENLLQKQEHEDTSDTTINKGKSASNEKTVRTVLPFKPLTIAFQDVNYYVDTPQEMREQGYKEKRIQLLHNITGAFRPGVLSALMGVTGAGKTTLLDVLSGRKTGGVIEGNITICGYKKVQHTFSRISGYCEQHDVHSPQITVEESVIYSAWLRLPPEIDPTTRKEFVNEVLETIELDGIKGVLVGIPGMNGLSNEQRKRLTIAVEFVSNPSIIFLDEPTSGLDARASAVVIRAMKKVVQTGRTVVCTIHQPGIDIFETFDELVLMKMGGKLIYTGPIGQNSSELIKYFQGIPGVPTIKDNYNPATWMLEVTSASTEAQIGVDFSHIYKESSQYKNNKELVEQLSIPSTGSRDLDFPTLYPQNGWVQFKACLWKHHLTYWRTPSYKLARIIFILFSSAIYSALLWKKGKKLDNQEDVFNMLGFMFVTALFMGVNNCSPVMPIVLSERAVLYRENFAGLYSPLAYSLAQVVIEIPYTLIQVILFMIITYPAVGYYWSASKFLWFFYIMFSTTLCFVYLGMLLASLAPNMQVASIMASFCYLLINIFSGFVIPGPHIPKWWIWACYLCPTSWSLNGFFSSQYGDIDKKISAFGETKSVADFLRDYLGYHHDRLWLVAAALLAFPIVCASGYTYFTVKLNFQRR